MLDRLPEAVAQLQEAPQAAQGTKLRLVIELQVHRVLVVAGLLVGLGAVSGPDPQLRGHGHIDVVPIGEELCKARRLAKGKALERSRKEERGKGTHSETALQDARARRGCHDIR